MLYRFKVVIYTGKPVGVVVKGHILHGLREERLAVKRSMCVRC